ncbi:hypothetical protein [Treponema brennaborense]|uniref:Uncharacterized protein n=1 Tax=Treponema brennaborense (strain DSM 12168 / CIP 105900 / DD5/3) TaxID=906968 RepID=F4LMB9_TREBD|nr:hypothetical protein [Treponema brennaborense]AEE17785.1 hypothetical protein Trebr_2376 [Treponema brennaborense DSM 12168]
MNQDQIKDMLLQIEGSELDFTVTFTGKESKKVNGLYKPDTYEILLHNKNFKADNQLIYTAIHEYTHHLLNEAKLAETGGLKPSYARVHTNEFWARFHGLLETAEQKGFYVIGLENSPELAQLTEELRVNYLEQNGRLMQEFGRLLAKAHRLCQEANIRYEDYIDRVLKLPRTAAKTIAKVAAVEVNPAIGFENMKLVASLPTPEKRSAAEQQILEGHSPDSVRSLMKKKSEETDARTRLEKEKQRLEKTITQLTSRLELVEESLAQL